MRIVGALRHNAGMDLRAKIRSRMKELGLSMRGASLAAGLNETWMRDFLDGRTSHPSSRTMEMLAPVLKVPVEWFVTDTKDAGDKDEAEIIWLYRHTPEGKKHLIRDLARALSDEKKSGDSAS